jgi:uncharacterized membrane protein (UPF0136 family)
MVNAQDSTHIGAPRSPIYLLFVVFGVALVIEIFIGVPLVAYGLETPPPILFPLVLITPNIYAAVVGSWAGTLLADDHTRTRLLSVVGITLATAVAIALIASLSSELLMSRAWLFVPAALLAVLLVPLSTSWATWRFRDSKDRMGREAVLVLVLAVVVYVLDQLHIFGMITIRGLSGETWLAIALSIASVALGVWLGVWRFRRRGDRLGMDAAITLCLVGLATLISAGTHSGWFVL